MMQVYGGRDPATAVAAAMAAMAFMAMLATPAAAAADAEQDRRPFSIEDFYRIQVPSGLDLTPDGQALVYSLRTTDLQAGEANRDLYRVTTGQRELRRLTWTAEHDESEPVFSPSGDMIAFVAQRGEQQHEQLWLLPVAGGEARPLTELSTGASGPVWSPDGKHIAFASRVHPDCGADDECNRTRLQRREEGPLSAHVADELLYRHWTTWADGRVTHVLVVDVETGQVRDLTPGEREAPVFSVGGRGGYAFSPDGSELCYTRNPDPLERLAWSTNSDLWVVPVAPGPDGATRQARNLTADNPAWDGSPAWSPDGRWIAYRRQARPGYEADRFELAVIDRQGGAARSLTPGFDNWVQAFEWLPAGDGLIFSAPRHGATPLYRVPLQAGQPPLLLAALAYLDEWTLSPDGTAAFAVSRAIDRPAELWRLDLAGGEARRLTQHNAELQRDVDLRPAETMWVEGAGGRRVHVFVIKPHGFDPARRWPLILNVHGGPQGMWADSFRGDWQMYPGAGYVVAFANPHGSTGYGQAFTEAISGDWGGRVFEDLMKVTDALERLPWIDGERMGAMGWSYGGYMMNWFQGHTDRFKALANMMGLFDLRSFYFATEELWFPEWDLGGTPWTSELYERWNPAAAVAEWDTPMLTITGELDFRVPYTQGLMAHTALRRRGIPSRLIVLPDAGHWPGWYEMALYYTAHLDWFHRFLDGDPPPWSVEDFVEGTFE